MNLLLLSNVKKSHITLKNLKHITDRMPQVNAFTECCCSMKRTRKSFDYIYLGRATYKHIKKKLSVFCTHSA